MAGPFKRIAVLCGEIVNNTDATTDRIVHALDVLEETARTLGPWQDTPLGFTRVRQGGWLVALTRPELALRVALVFRAALWSEDGKPDTYVGMACGVAPDRVGPNLNLETSEAFIGASHALDYLRGAGHRRFSFHADVALEGITALVDHVSGAWTKTQASAALPFLTPGSLPSYTEVAKAQGKTRQAVTKAVQAADLEVLTYALMCAEEARRQD